METHSEEPDPESALTAEGTDLPPEPTSPNPDAELGTQSEEAAKGQGQTQEGEQGLGSTALHCASPPPLSPAGDSPACSSDSMDVAHTQTNDGDGSLLGSTFDKVSFISRPWRIVDGSLNKPVCKGMLESLLFHIMSKPGLSEPVLFEHYRDVLQPVVLLDLLLALEKMGCVQKRYMTGQPRATLFSPARASEVKEGGGVKLGDRSTAFYEPTVDCCLRLGKVFPHEANWNKWVPFIHS
ncbi:hypothetical protein AAFF_G00084690 [Aldrovandia affinis]|uniref:Uncharacterized protein n=1 Tax=Aldrovandia affinis TaxID=143900 RepID=A0AAD7RWV4_9TELE|nr:hypothetical protein AAFF_G00084690 [Aldrovandia affinis]